MYQAHPYMMPLTYFYYNRFENDYFTNIALFVSHLAIVSQIILYLKFFL